MRRVLMAVLLAALTPLPVSAEWRSLRSDHFEVIGNVSAGQLRDVALRFEQFREVVTQLVPSAVRGGSAPVVVIVFPDNRSYEPFMPRVDGRRIPVAGTFQGAADVNYITLSLEAGDQAFPVIFHEYSHLILDGVFANAPVWFNEGLAEYYSTLEIVNGGRRANLGKPVEAHIALLRERRLRLSQLFGIERGSREYTRDSIEREILYAQSWAVVHHALHGDTNRRDPLHAFVRRVAAGDEVNASLRETYGMTVDELDADVQAYTRQQIFRATQFEFATNLVTRVTANAASIDEADVDARLGDLLAHMQRTGEAEARLQKALLARPDHPRARAALGMLKARQGEHAAAVDHLQKAAALDRDVESIQFAYAYALTLDRANDSDGMKRASAALERALELRPGYPAAQQLLASLYVSSGEYAKARTLLTPVVKASPTDHESALLLAAALLGLNEIPAARALIGPLVARPPNPSVGTRARTLLGQLAGLARAQERRQEAAGAPQVSADRAQTPAPGPPANEQPRQPGFAPLLRQLRDGEQRSFGTFDEIECTKDGIVLIVRAADGLRRARAANFTAVEFISYRSLTSGGNVSCGQQPKMPALLTWRMQETGLPLAVALELLPEGFVP